MLQCQEESKHLKFTQINIRYSMGDANGGGGNRGTSHIQSTFYELYNTPMCMSINNMKSTTPTPNYQSLVMPMVTLNMIYN